MTRLRDAKGKFTRAPDAPPKRPKPPRGWAWRGAPMCPSKRAQASYARYRKVGKEVSE